MATDRTERRGAGAGAPGFVALFIDWDNFAIGLRQEMPDRPADVGPILRWSRRFGVLSVVRAYGEWRDPSERLAIYNAGVEVVYAPVLPLGGSVQARAGAGGAKSLADTAMAVDVTDALNLMPSITTVILATSDKDLIPVLRFAQRRGLHAVVVGSDRTAGALRDLADEFISYRQLLDSEVPTGTQSRPVMVPPVRYPRAGGRSEGQRALPPPERGRSGRFESRSVVVPLDRPLAASAPSVSSIGSAGNDEPAPATTSVGTPGSVFADGEDQPAGDAAARRRRRGGRRRRGREVTGDGDVAAAGMDDADEADETDRDGAEAVDAVTVGAGDLAARGPEAVQVATVEDEPDVPSQPTHPEPIIQRRAEPPVGRAEPPAGSAPVVLPGERLRRLVPQPAPEPEPTPTAAQAAASAPVAEREPAGETEPAGAAEEPGADDSSATKSAATRGRGRSRVTAARASGGGGGRASAASGTPGVSAKGSRGAERPAEEPPEDAGSDAADQGESEESPDSASKTTRTPARGRRRGGRTR